MIATAEEIAGRIAKVTKSMHKDIIAMYVETILDEVEDRILNKEGAGSDDIIEIISKVKEQVNGEV